jgi:hypothetical protein
MKYEKTGESSDLLIISDAAKYDTRVALSDVKRRHQGWDVTGGEFSRGNGVTGSPLVLSK